MGHMTITIPSLWVISHPFGNTRYSLPVYKTCQLQLQPFMKYECSPKIKNGSCNVNCDTITTDASMYKTDSYYNNRYSYHRLIDRVKVLNMSFQGRSSEPISRLVLKKIKAGKNNTNTILHLCSYKTKSTTTKSSNKKIIQRK